MNLTIKRILILFSICLNIGFVAAAVHHSLGDNAERGPRGAFQHVLAEMEMNDAQRDVMNGIEDRMHENMQRWKERLLAIKADGLEAMTRPEGPDTTRLDADLDKEAALMREKNLEMRALFLEARDVLGPEKLRVLGTRMLQHHRKH